MEAEIATRLERYMDALEKGVSKGAEFVADQAPLVAQEWLNWEFCYAVFWASCAAIVAVCIIYFLYSMRSRIAEGFNSEEPGWILATSFCGTIFVACAFAIPTNTCAAIKVKVAPRVVLLEKIGELAKGKK